MKKLNETTIRIDSGRSIIEEWYRGRVEHKEDVHEFWFIYTQGPYFSEDYPYRIEWMRRHVPLEVRGMENKIIEEFEIMKNRI